MRAAFSSVSLSGCELHLHPSFSGPLRDGGLQTQRGLAGLCFPEGLEQRFACLKKSTVCGFPWGLDSGYSDGSAEMRQGCGLSSLESPNLSSGSVE